MHENSIQIIKPADIVLVIILILSIILPHIRHRRLQNPAAFAEVLVDDRSISKISLNTDSLYHIEGMIGTSDIVVQDHHIRMFHSPCPHKTCMKMGAISQTGQIIVCIPNRIIIRVEGQDIQKLDGVTQ